MRLGSLPSLLSLLVFTFSNDVSAASIVERATTTAPIVVAARDGNDGPWSSFAVLIGTPAQDVKVFVSTAVGQTLVVVPEGCVSTDPPNCAALRGNEFQLLKSSTWVNNTANLSTNIYPLEVGTRFGYSGKAELGFDDITLGWQGAGGPTLKNQTVGGFAAKDSYLGLFGLLPRPSNFTTFDDPTPSYMQNLRNQSMIPSTSWAYTAGNQYCFDRVLGSLVLGGYDRSKFIEHDVTWSFNVEDIRDLTVQIESIMMFENTSQSSLLPTPIPALLDSSLPYIWLPTEACALFEDAFGLVWDNDTQFYLVNSSQHDALVAQNANLTFTLGNLTAGVNVNITLPYAAFDLTAESPLIPNNGSSRYYPLKRAATESQYTLGRTFFQEAYVIADYERGNFSVSQCSWDASAQQDVVPIYPPGFDGVNPKTNGTFGSSTHHIVAGPVAGGVVGGLVVLGCAAFAVWYFYIKSRRGPPTATPIVDESGTLPQYLMINKPELDNQEVDRIHEIEGKVPEWRVESDAQEVQIHEMPASENVAVELRSGLDAVEMATSSNINEMGTPSNVPEMAGSESRARSMSMGL